MLFIEQKGRLWHKCFVAQSNYQEDAAEHLRVIRTLMERATVYEALSTPAAFLGGVVGLATAFLIPATASTATFLSAWFCAWLLVNIFNAFLLSRGARQRDEPFISSGMRLTLKAVWPPLATGFALGTATVLATDDKAMCAAIWAVFYGLAILAMNGFAPRALLGLGGAFTLAGTATAIALLAAPENVGHWLTDKLVMGVTFGLFHAGYAACVKVLPRHRA